MAMSDQEIGDYVRQYAPELDPDDVRAFMAQHDRPEGESDAHVVWATRVLRQRGEGQYGEGASLEAVEEAMREHDARNA